jgi:cysteine/O-acetylserine efflux protein
MEIDWLGFITFVLITTFSPGPNNISSASLGILVGHRKSLPYMWGIFAGVFPIMLVCGVVASTILGLSPTLEIWLRWIGATYILWLAWHTLHASYSFDESKAKPLGFVNGLLLQVLNPKLIIYGLTLFSTFLSSIAGNFLWVLAMAALQSINAFASVNLWSAFGSAIREYLKNDRLRFAVNLVLALSLVYIAVDMTGVLKI